MMALVNLERVEDANASVMGTGLQRQGRGVEALLYSMSSLLLSPPLPTHFPPLPWSLPLALCFYLRHHLQDPYCICLLGKCEHHHLHFAADALLLFLVMRKRMNWQLEEEEEDLSVLL